MYDGLKVFIVPHVHWDREWYMSLQPSIARFTRMMDYMLDLFERKPQYKTFHLDGQYLPLKDYLELRPEKRETIAKYVKEGRLVIGPWYAPPTETFVSGEAMIRNLEMGIRESNKLGGCSDVCWIVDVLGHVSQMPMICDGFGIKKYVTCRALPPKSKKVFRWVGSDGSEVLVFYVTGSYGSGRVLPQSLEDTTEVIDNTEFPIEGLRKRIDSLLGKFADRRTTNNDIITNGCDHSFPQSDIDEVIEVLKKEYPNTEFVHASAGEYLDAVCQDHDEKSIPYESYKGEMFFSQELPVLEPINSVRVDLKIINAHIERLMERWTEPFSAYSYFLGAQYRTAEIDKAWELILQNQSHDTLGCSSVDPIYKHALTRYEWANDVAKDVLSEQLDLLAYNASNKNGEMQVAVFNPLNIERNEVVLAEIDIPQAYKIANPAFFCGSKRIRSFIREKRETVMRRYNPRNGRPGYVPVDRYEFLLELSDVPQSGYSILTVKDDGEKGLVINGSLIRSYRIMENEYIRVTINNNGTFDLLNKEDGAEYKELHFFEDSSEVGSGFARQTVMREETIFSFGQAADISVVEDCAIKAAFKIHITMQIPRSALKSENGRSNEVTPIDITSVISITAGSKRVDIHTTINNTANDHRLRVFFPSRINSQNVLVGQPFDVVSRNITPADPNEYPPAPNQYPWKTHAQNGFIDMNDGKSGLSVFSDGLFEYEVTDDDSSSVALTLIRSMFKLEFAGHVENEEEHMELAQCIGKYEFDYSVEPHTEGYEKTYFDWECFKTPIKVMPVKAPENSTLLDYVDPLRRIELGNKKSFVKVSGRNIILSAVKKQYDRDTLIVRVYNFGTTSENAEVEVLIPGFEIDRAYLVNLAETRLAELHVENGSLIKRIVDAHGVLTVEFQRRI